MKFDCYISEMGVTDMHGGGLTLQRVIGDDLYQIPYFVHVSRFASGYAVVNGLKDKVLDLSSPWDSNLMRKIIGRTRASSISQKTQIIKSDARRAAKLLDKKFAKGRTLNVLICPQAAQAIYTLEALKRYRKVNYVTWVMDDHLVKYADGNWYYPDGMEPVFAKHLQQAQQVFVISPAMQQFYNLRFGVKSAVLFGPADFASPLTKATQHTGDMLKIGYFGAVTNWQLDAMEHLANAIANTGTQLHIYSGITALPQPLAGPNVQLMGRLSPDMVLPAMQQYDAILLPMSFTERMRSMSEFNIATKMSEYLASGVPILAIGPPYAAMVSYLKNSGAAIAVETGHRQDIENALAQLKNVQLVNDILQQAKNLVQTQTGTQPMRNRWNEINKKDDQAN